MPASEKSRNRDALKHIAGDDATELVWTLRMHGIDAAACVTVTWTRRHILDVALELAARRVAQATVPHRVIVMKSTAEIEAEDAAWTDEDVMTQKRRYDHGERDDLAMTGRRIYQRRVRRRMRERQVQAQEETA